MRLQPGLSFTLIEHPRDDLNVHWRVINVHHEGTQFTSLQEEAAGARQGTRYTQDAVLVPGSGTFGMESVARQFAHGKHVMVIRNGWFSYRWTQIFDMGAIPASHTVLKARKTAEGANHARTVVETARSEAEQSAVIVIGGCDRLAASALANQLTEWFDSRTVRICAPDAASIDGRPFLWPYWQEMPAKGRLTIVVGDWLTRTAVEVASHEISGDALRARLKSLRTFEELLAADGTSVVKVWLETSEKTLRKRLRDAEDTDAEGWMVSEEDLLLAKHSSLTLCRALRSQGSGKNLPWKVVMGGTETKHRDLSAGLVIAAQMGQVSRRRLRSGQRARRVLAHQRRVADRLGDRAIDASATGFLLLSHVSLPDDLVGESLRPVPRAFQHSHAAASGILGKICSAAGSL